MQRVCSITLTVASAQSERSLHSLKKAQNMPRIICVLLIAAARIVTQVLPRIASAPYRKLSRCFIQSLCRVKLIWALTRMPSHTLRTSCAAPPASKPSPSSTHILIAPQNCPSFSCPLSRVHTKNCICRYSKLIPASSPRKLARAILKNRSTLPCEIITI